MWHVNEIKFWLNSVMIPKDIKQKLVKLKNVQKANSVDLIKFFHVFICGSYTDMFLRYWEKFN